MGNKATKDVYNEAIHKELAFQIIHVEADSPADQVGLEPYFDFLIELPNSIIPYNTSYGSIDRFLSMTSPVGREIDLDVFSLRSKSVRRVTFTARFYRTNTLDLTGIVYRPVIINEAIVTVDHVTDVSVGSPAYIYGLVPKEDYVIAIDEGECFDLHRMSKPHDAEASSRCFVLNITTLRSRIVILPSLHSSSNEYRIGCTFSRGLLHRVPIDIPARTMLTNAEKVNDNHVVVGVDDNLPSTTVDIETKPQVCVCGGVPLLPSTITTTTSSPPPPPPTKDTTVLVSNHNNNNNPTTTTKPKKSAGGKKGKKQAKTSEPQLRPRVAYHPEVCGTVTTLQLPDQPGKTLSVSAEVAKSIVRDFLPQFIANEGSKMVVATKSTPEPAKVAEKLSPPPIKTPCKSAVSNDNINVNNHNHNNVPATYNNTNTNGFNSSDILEV